MIVYPNFRLVHAPRTGTEWFRRTMERFEIKPIHIDDAYSIPPVDNGKYTVTVIRHPFDWLSSLYFNTVKTDQALPEILEKIVDLAKSSPNFDTFIRWMSNVPGTVEQMFDEYRADTYIRLEDFPWAVGDLLYSLGFGGVFGRLTTLPPINVGIAPSDFVDWKRQRQMIVKSEKKFCERFEYY